MGGDICITAQKYFALQIAESAGDSDHIGMINALEGNQ